jgi:hypothetical protein
MEIAHRLRIGEATVKTHLDRGGGRRPEGARGRQVGDVRPEVRLRDRTIQDPEHLFRE